jgi:hypothetical protein
LLSEGGTRDPAADPGWLPDCKTATDELRFLGEAAARIRNARIAFAQHDEDQPPDAPSLTAAGVWEEVVANAAREAARVSAQLAHIGLDVGSIAVVRRKADNNRLFKALEVHFRDGDEVRSPSLVFAGYRDGSLHYGWLGRRAEPGRLDHTQDFSPQIRRLVLRLCEFVALGYANDANRSAPVRAAAPTALRLARGR